MSMNRMNIFRTAILGLLLVVILSSLVISYPITPFKIIVVSLLLLGVMTFYFEGLFPLQDLLFLFLVVGTFVFGKAFSVIGFNIGPLPLFATEITLFGSLLFILFRPRKAFDNWKQALPPGLFIALLLYLVVGTIYLFVGLKTHGTMALRDVVFCHYTLFFFITVYVLNSSVKIKTLIPLFISPVVVVTLLGYLRFFMLRTGKIALFKFTNVTKAFNWALVFGLIALAVLCFFAYANEDTKKKKFLKGFLIYSGLLMMLMTHVRAAWGGLIIALVFLGIVLKKEVKVIIIIIPLVIGSLFITDQIFSRLDNIDKLTEEVESLLPGAEITFPKMNIIWRMKIWKQTLEKIEKKPILGWGFGSFPRYILRGRKAPEAKGIGPGSMILPPHNHLLAIFYKMGIVGLLLFIIINLWVFLLGIGYIKKCRDPFNRRFLIFTVAGLLYWHGMAFFFDVLESPPTGIFLWILLGSIIGIIYTERKGSPQNTQKDTEKEKDKDFEKRTLFGIDYAIVDYEKASDVIIEHAEKHRSFGVSALAVHGLVTSVKDKAVGERVKKIDMVVPDGQPVRWALNSFHKVGLKDRVYGPTLTLHVLEKASQKKLNVYLYGSTEETLERFSASIKKNYPGVNICGLHPDRFRDAAPEEDAADIEKINKAGAHIVLVGRGCPRQEVWVADHLGKVSAAMLAVGAAFDFHAGTLKQAPKWMQDHGMEWFYRLIKEPRRLWKRYLVTNSYFIYLFLKYKLFTNSPKAGSRDPAVKSDA